MKRSRPPKQKSGLVALDKAMKELSDRDLETKVMLAGGTWEGDKGVLAFLDDTIFIHSDGMVIAKAEITKIEIPETAEVE